MLGLASMSTAGTCIRALALGVGVLTTAACVAGEQDTSVSQTTQASTFDWGSDCSSGSGQFTDSIPLQQTKTIGEIPANKRNVTILLDANADVDVQLVDKLTGDEIIAWPSGLLNGDSFACATYKDVEYCYSGYNGLDGNWGKEQIEIRGNSNRTLVMKAFGYQAGDADVTYAWQPTTTCNEKGNGSFTTSLNKDEVETIGDIPANKIDVEIKLDSNQDLDIQLFDGETALVKWPNGLLNGPNTQVLQHNGMKITWSGYNGDGTLAGLGNEYIRIEGRVSSTLTMKAFAFQSGSAEVTYEWGIGAGAACGSLALPVCADGFTCKNGNDGNIAVDKPGTCHNQFWCESNASVDSDCNGLIHPAVPGSWACEEFTCKWQMTIPEQTCSLANQACPQGYECQIGCPTGENCGINPPGVCLKTCSLFNQDCPAGTSCQVGCPSGQNCGINPPGICEPL